MAVGALTPITRWQILDNGTPAAGAKLYTYASGGNTPLAVYTNSALTVAHTNPVVADAEGVLPVIYMQAASYRFFITDANGVTIFAAQDGIYDFAQVQLVASSGSSLIGFIQAGSGAVARTAQAKMRERISAADFGATGDGVTDDTAALQAAYAYAKLVQAPLYIGPGDYVFTSALTWDGYVTVYGAGRGQAPSEGTTLRKKGTFTGITIASGGEMVEYRDFVLNGHVSGAGGVGIDVRPGTSGLALRNLQVVNQGSHGILVSFASGCLFQNLQLQLNGGDGLRFACTGTDYSNANTILLVNTAGNTGYGLNIAGGGDGTYSNQCFGITAQNNTQYGVRVNDLQNEVHCYCETNTAGDVLLDTLSIRNNLFVTNTSGGLGGVDDLGTNNIIWDLANGAVRIPIGISPIARPTNLSGSAFSIAGGAGGAGASGVTGGTMSVLGGDAAGTAGSAAGGAVIVNGGAGVNGGAIGSVTIQTAGGTTTLGLSANAIKLVGSALAAASYIEMLEGTAPSAAPANSVRLYTQDNGGGKTQLMAIFASGAAQQIAIEP